jgi:hypothetical protein
MTTEAKAVTVIEALAAVMADVQAVGKDSQNTSQGFPFRGIDAVMNAVGPALRTHGVVIIPTVEHTHYRDIEVGSKRTPMREVTVRVRYRVYGPAGDELSGVVSAESMDSGDKATAKAFSVAYRTFLLQTLTIPTDEPDPDATTYERAPVEEPKASEGDHIAIRNLQASLDADQRKLLVAWWTDMRLPRSGGGRV